MHIEFTSNVPLIPRFAAVVLGVRKAESSKQKKFNKHVNFLSACIPHPGDFVLLMHIAAVLLVVSGEH